MPRTLVACALGFALAGCASLTSPSPEKNTPRCLSIARIHRTQIVDDQVILFHMRDGTIFRNELPQRCYGLRIQNGFGYATPLDRVCDLDVIQVLGGTLSRCNLGRFDLIEPSSDLTQGNRNTNAPAGAQKGTAP